MEQQRNPSNMEEYVVDVEVPCKEAEACGSHKSNSGSTVTGNAFSIIDDGRVVSAHVCMELALSKTETALPCGLKSSSLAKSREAFAPWITYVSESQHVKTVNFSIIDEKMLIVWLAPVLLFLLGACFTAFTLLLHTVAGVILASFMGFGVYKTVQARSAFQHIANEVSELANRLQKALEPDSAKVYPICVQGGCFGSCHFFLDITVPVWNRSVDKRTIAEAQQDDVELCPICLEEFQESQLIRVLPCSHRYHAACADGWLRNSILCPLCKCATGGDTRCTFVV